MMSTLLRGNKGPTRAGRSSKRGGRGGRVSGATEHNSNLVSSASDDDPFREERLRNAARRENSKGTTANGEGKNNRQAVDKKVRFPSPLSPASGSPATSRDSSVEPQVQSRKTSNSAFNKMNGKSGTLSNPSSATQNNPFKTMSESSAGSTRGSSVTSVFGASSPFGSSNKNSAPPTGSNPFSKPTASQPSTNGFSSFGSAASAQSSTGFGSNNFPSSKPQTTTSATPTFGAPSSNSTSKFPDFSNQAKNSSNSYPFGGNVNAPQSTNSSSFGTPTSTFGLTQPVTNGGSKQSNTHKAGMVQSFGGLNHTPIPNGIPTVSNSKLALDMQNLLRKAGIDPPPWPVTSPGDPAQKGAVEGHWRNYKVYRAKARACLIKNNLIDDPEKPKKLSEAIDFKGTCEEMCPEFEKITRIMENDVKGPEKEVVPGQTTPWPAPHKMIKALARSAAGQDAPLPEDVRSPAALRRTLDYLMGVILTEETLPEVHGFLWDRTRAIRRDFTFQAQSMNTEQELLDQVYCLEQITRFHVISLHQMSPRRLGEKITEDFTEQQEVEQLGKALLSLTHAYEDCKGFKVKCENEAEFRSYYVVFNAHYSGIMETVQDWGWEFWGESDKIRTAVMIVEALQNTWDQHGPLKPESPAVVAQNAYSKFFSIIKDPSISYTMACFVEIHFNLVRKSALKTIATSYRKQRDQTKEWTLSALNEILQFDEEEEVEKFCEAYSLTIQGSGEDEPYLSLEEEYPMDDPFPKLSQLHSSIVERKRGYKSLKVAIQQTIFEEVEDDDSLFVRDSRTESRSSQLTKSPTPVQTSTFGFSSTSSSQQQSLLGSNSTSVGALCMLPTLPATMETPPMVKNTEQAFGNTSFFNQGATSSSSMQPIGFCDHNSTLNKLPEAKAMTFDFSPKPSTSTPPATFTAPATFTPAKETQTQQETLLDNGSQNSLSQAPMPAYKFGDTSTPPKLPDFSSMKAMPNSGSLSTQPIPSPPTQPAVASTLFPRLQSSGSVNTLLNPPQKQSDSPATEMSQMATAPQLPLPTPKPLPSLESRLPAFAEWFAMGKDGIVQNFLEYQVESIVLQTVAQYQKDEEERQIKEEDDKAREEADAFRRRSLSVRYGYLWRDNAHMLWRRRQGIENRRVRAERMAEMKAASEAAKAVDLVAEFTATVKRKSIEDVDDRSSKRRSSEDLLRATGILDFVHDPNEEIRNVINPNSALIRSGRADSPLVIPPPTFSDRKIAKHKHQRSQSQSQISTSFLSNSSYLQGGSRSLLLPPGWNDLLGSKTKSNVKTDYFRMKARGIMTLPNGAPIANSAARHLLKQKRLSDGIIKDVTTPRRSIRRTEVRSVPAKTNGILHDNGDDELSQLKYRANTLLNGDSDTRAFNRSKRQLDADDEELFAKAKRIREQMDEGAEWFREEMRRESMSNTGS